jgi:hypothetical protein
MAAGDAAAVRKRLEAKRDRIEGERQRNIDLVIKYVISEEDARNYGALNLPAALGLRLHEMRRAKALPVS